jgi:large subunit ribosomal protein LP1
MASQDLAVVYAALILEDDGIPITGDKIRKLLDAANVTVESYWVDLFVEYFKNNDITSLLKGTALCGGEGGGGAGAAAPSAGAADSSGTAAAEPAKDEKKEEEAVLDIFGGFDDLFG